MRSFAGTLILTLLIICGCKQTPTAPVEEELFHSEKITVANGEVKEVVYSMYLPTDLAEVFAHQGINYDPGIPAPITDATLYETPEQVALMLGVYGVDITYMKFLNQGLDAAKYYNTIEKLSAKVGIPAKIFEESARQLEQHFNNEDSLNMVIDRIYRYTDQHFKTNGQENLAALSLMGGWIEAMYIGSSVYAADSGNHVIAERLLHQKFSLNGIYTLLSNHQESLEIRGNLLLLKRLRNLYDKVDIRYQKDGFQVDTTNKKLQAYSAEIHYSDQTLKELVEIIPMVREELIKHSE